MEHFSLMELWSIKKRMIEENFQDKELFNLVLETINIKEKLIFVNEKIKQHFVDCCLFFI
jgi:hypothetical protein